MRLIDADALKEHYNVPDAEGVFSYCDTIMQVIDSQPTIEPEVRHGRWIKNGKKSVFGDLEYLCSECGRKTTVNWAVIDPSEYNAFCSGCGADMREEGADND